MDRTLNPVEMERVLAWIHSAVGSPNAPAQGPVSLLLDGSHIQEYAPTWQTQATTVEHVDRVVETLQRSTAEGLAYTLEFTRHLHSPAVEWVARFANHGQIDTPILSNILPLDVLFPLESAEACQVHHARGGLSRTDDFEPLNTPLTFRQGGSSLTLTARTGKSSTLHLPFFNLEMGTGGVIGAIGWSGGWSTSFQRTREGVHVCAGMERTHLRLHPGEEIRTPRMLLLFWEGDRDEAHNTWRRLILEHYTPRPHGESLLPPFCDGVWGARTAQSHMEKIRWLYENRIPTESYWIDARLVW